MKSMARSSAAGTGSKNVCRYLMWVANSFGALSVGMPTMAMAASFIRSCCRQVGQARERKPAMPCNALCCPEAVLREWGQSGVNTLGKKNNKLPVLGGVKQTRNSGPVVEAQLRNEGGGRKKIRTWMERLLGYGTP